MSASDPQPPSFFAALRHVNVAKEHEVERRLRALAVRALAQRVEQALRLRNLPVRPEFRTVVRNPAPPRTRALGLLLDALHWRRARRLPTGESPSALVILSGGVGCGKSAAGCWIVARWPGNALRVSALDIAEMPETRWGEIAELREQWMTVELLLLDDVGMERERARLVAERISGLLQRRYEEGRLTFVTTNRTAEAFTTLYLTTYGDVVDGTTERTALRGTARMASRLSNEQLGQGGLPYFHDLSGEPDYRDPDYRSRLDALPRVTDADLDAFLVS